MLKNIKKKLSGLPRAVLCLRLLQLFILSAAFFVWFIHRGSGYQNLFTAEDYIYLTDFSTAGSPSIHEGSGFQGDFIRTPALTLDKGSYQLLLSYAATAENSLLSVRTEQLDITELHCVELALAPDSHTAVMTLELPRSVTDLEIHVSFSGAGSLEILGLSLAATGADYRRGLFYALLACLLLSLLYRFHKASPSSRAVMLALSGIFAVSCYPLYLDYLTVGHDLPFHLLRIEGIADGLSSGIFPVKIHPVWAKDYGYAVGVLYGDMLLYFPALLRLLGFSVQSAYQIFAAAVNLGTVVISYFCFKRMFQSARLGLLGSLLYTLSYYRLADTYTRAAVGEYTAMLFLPLVLLGFYLIFSDAKKENWLKYAILTAFGLTGLIQTHILSCEMAGFCIILACVILIRRVLKKYTLLSLAGGLMLTILLNLGFLVPFLEYFTGNLLINSPDWSGNVQPFFQSGGLFPVQLFSVFQNSNGGSWSTYAGVANEAAYGLGILFLSVIILFLYLLFVHYRECRSQRNFKAAEICFGLGCLLAWMSTCYFPWNSIASWGGVAEKLTSSLQFPWRLLAFSTVLLTFTGCFAVSALFRIYGRNTAGICLMGMLLLMSVNVGWYFYDLVYSAEPYRVYDTGELNTMTLYSYEYLPEGTDPELIQADLTYLEGIGGIEAFQKHGTDITCHVTGQQAGATIDFPLIYYKHYICERLDTGEQLPVGPGRNNMVRVTFPGGIDIGIRIRFREPWYWRLSELISLAVGLGCLVFWGIGFRRRESVHIIQFKR